MAYLSLVVYINEEDYSTLLSEGEITKGGETYEYDESALYIIKDVSVPEYATRSGYAATAGTSTMAVNDGSGNNIVQTYGKKPLVIEVNESDLNDYLENGTYNSVTLAISENREVIIKITRDDVGDNEIDYFNLSCDARSLSEGYYFYNALSRSVLELYSNDYIDYTMSSPNDHLHGYISSLGQLSTIVTIANNDRLVIVDSSNTNKIKASSISFNGSTTSKALTQKGTWENVVNSVNGQSGAVTLGTAASLNAGSANGVATLDSSGKVPANQLPSYVDDIVEGYYKEADGKFYSTLSGTTYSNEITAESGKIYVDLTTSKSYRWSGSSYIIINANSEPEIIIHEINSTIYPNANWGDEYNESGLNILDSTLYNTISQEIADGKEVLIKAPFYMGVTDVYLRSFITFSEILIFSNSSYIDNYLYSFGLEILRDGNINYYIKNPEFLTEDLINLDGIKGAIVSRFCSCTTAAATAAKTASIAQGEFTLLQGTTVYVNFINANTADNPTLNISNSGAKNIFINGTLITTGDNKKALSGIVTFIYDGTLWNIISNYFDDISGKADKVTNAVNGNFAGLDANGNLTDSGKKASDFATLSSLNEKVNKVSSSTDNAVVRFDGTSGAILNSGVTIDDNNKLNGFLDLTKGDSNNAVLFLTNKSASTDYGHIFVSNADKSHTTRPLVLQNGYGNVGIGVALPTQKLLVDGNIQGKNIIIQGSNTSNTTRYLTSDANNNIYASINSTTPLVITNTEVRRGGSASSINLGNSSYPWNNVYGKKFIVNGGTASQFLKADGSVDNNEYINTSSTAQSKAGNLTATKFITSGGTSSLVLLGNGTLQAKDSIELYEAYLKWGGKDFSGRYGPIDAAMVGDLGANRFAFGKVAGISIEYSRDGGNTWIDYEAPDSVKGDLFSNKSSYIRIGKASSESPATTDYQTRVTITLSSFRLYTVLNKFVIYVSTSGSTYNWCTIMGRLRSNYDNNVDSWSTFKNKVPIGGWSGYNVINYPNGITFGGNSSQVYLLRFIFGCDGAATSLYPGMIIYNISAFGGMGWTTPSWMAKNGHLYSYDYLQNATFPANITATAIKKSGGTSSLFLKADGSVDSSVYAPLASPALTGTPTAPTASLNTNTTLIATTAFVTNAVLTIMNASPATLLALNDLATALGNDPNLATTLSAQIAAKYTKPVGGIPSSDLAEPLVHLTQEEYDALSTAEKNNGTWYFIEEE